MRLPRKLLNPEKQSTLNADLILDKVTCAVAGFWQVLFSVAKLMVLVVLFKLFI